MALAMGLLGLEDGRLLDFAPGLERAYPSVWPMLAIGMLARPLVNGWYLGLELVGRHGQISRKSAAS
jgi:hypothetical protein